MRSIYKFGSGFILDTKNYWLRHNSKAVEMSINYLKVLALLVEKHGKLVLKKDICLAAGKHNLDKHFPHKAISDIRKQLKEYEDTEFIETITGDGYRFVSNLQPPLYDEPTIYLTSDSINKSLEDRILIHGLLSAIFDNLKEYYEYLFIVKADTSKQLNNKAEIFKEAQDSQCDIVITVGVNKNASSLETYFRIEDVATKRQFAEHKIEYKSSSLNADDEQEFASLVLEKLSISSVYLGGKEIKLYSPTKTVPATTSSNSGFQDFSWGRFLLAKRQVDAVKEAISYFEKAIKANANMAQAYALLAEAYLVLGSMTTDDKPPTEVMPKATQAVETALSIDNKLSDAYASRASIQALYEWNWDEAEKSFQKVFSLDPAASTSRCWYAQCLAIKGRKKDALEAIDTAINTQLDIGPASAIVYAMAARVFYLLSMYEESIQQCEQTLKIDENYFLGHLFLAYTLTQIKDFNRAFAEFEYSLKLSEDNPSALGEQAFAYGLSGDVSKAEEILTHLLSLQNKRYVSPYSIAKAYAGVNEKDKAFAELYRAVEHRSGWLIYLSVDPSFARSLKDGPRYEELIRQVGF